MSKKKKEQPEDPHKATGGLDLNSPTTKQAMLRLGIHKSELELPNRTPLDKLASSVEREVAKLQDNNKMGLFKKAVKAVKNERNHILALKYLKHYEVGGK